MSGEYSKGFNASADHSGFFDYLVRQADVGYGRDK